jgi:hypothetical protein
LEGELAAVSQKIKRLSDPVKHLLLQGYTIASGTAREQHALIRCGIYAKDSHEARAGHAQWFGFLRL